MNFSQKISKTNLNQIRIPDQTPSEETKPILNFKSVEQPNIPYLNLNKLKKDESKKKITFDIDLQESEREDSLHSEGE